MLRMPKHDPTDPGYCMNDMKDEDVSPEDAVLTADALKAMGHPLRWRILCALGENEITVGELAKQIGTTQSNMSQHLDQLRNKRILAHILFCPFVLSTDYCSVSAFENAYLVDIDRLAVFKQR